MRIFIFFCFAWVILHWSSCKSENTLFTLIDDAHTGITFENTITETDSFNIMRNEYMYNGGGVGVADLNNDGWQDLIFAGNKVLSRIYLNQGGFNFQDITDRFEGLDSSQWISGVSIVDINVDGYIDLYFTSTNSRDSLLRRNQLWVNQGIDTDGLPRFIEQASEYGIADMGYSVHASFFDYDLDGDLDLYILNNIVLQSVPTNYRDKIVDGSSSNNDRLYKNLGNGMFENVSTEAGITIEGYGLGLSVSDINQDGYPDIYVSNDYIANDILYINQGNGTFINQIADYLSYQSKFSMGNDISDMNNDGLVDILTVDMLPEDYHRKKQTINGNSYLAYINDEKFGYQTQYVRNMLHLNNGFVDGQLLPFSEIGQIAGIHQTEWSWSPLFMDVDNDGDRDLLVTNGFPKDLTDKDFTNYKAQMYGYLAGDQDVLPRIPVVEIANYGFENMGELQFRDQSLAWGLKSPSFSTGAAFVDLNNDGYLDYVVNNINKSAFIYKNTLSTAKERSHFLRIKLKGSNQNPLAIGAKVHLYAGGTLQFMEHFLSRGYISSVDPIVHFGLGSIADVDSIIITWPDGLISRVVSPSIDKEIQLDYAELLKDLAANSAPGKLPFNEVPGPDYVHHQEDYIDFFQEQRLLLHKFSQIGPSIAAGDITGDGNEEIVIAGSQDQALRVYRFLDGRFDSLSIAGLTERPRAVQSDLALVDVDGDGDLDIIAVSGGYANRDTAEYEHYILFNEGDHFSKSILPIPPFIASTVVALDVDKDGDLDLFIGARVTRSGFPHAPPSYLLINENGNFTANKVEAFELGMVTDVVVSDYNLDGWQDLVITRSWNSIIVLENRGGSLKKKPLADAEGYHGLWNTVLALDFDQDGDEDYLLGNLGQNHRFNISEDYPLRLYATDIDQNGVVDPLISGYWLDRNGAMKEYPIHYLDELAAQSPFFRKRFTSYQQFSYCTMDSIVDKREISTSDVFSINTDSHYLLRNDGGGKFSWQVLPRAVQVSPIKALYAVDLENDGKPEIIIVGNDYSFEVSTGYMDANKGAILVNGSDGLRVLSSSQTGLYIPGQVESICSIKDGKYFLFGINRNKITVFEHLK